MSWREIDLAKQVITIPATRIKGKREHIIPIAPMLMALLESLPRFAGGDAVFTMNGTTPVSGFSKPKLRVDAECVVNECVVHDLRRTMRSHLSALPIEDRVREQMIGHSQPGLHKVYNKYA